MTQQNFSVEKEPKVVISRVEGNLSIYGWEEMVISVDAPENAGELRQEGDTLIITGCKGDLALHVPAITKGFRYIGTGVDVTQLSGNMTIENVGHVTLKEITGNVVLKNAGGDLEVENVHGTVELMNIGGDLKAASMPTLLAKRGIGGDVTLSDIARIEVDAVGGSLAVNRAGTVSIHAVGGNLQVEEIETALKCHAVGGDCRMQNSANAEVSVHNVGGNLQMEGTLRGSMSNVGGNLDLQATFPADTSTRFHVGGNATVTVPDDASLSLHGIIGGQVSGEALGSSMGGSFFNLVYGDGTARLSLIVGGNLRLSGNAVPRSRGGFESWYDFGRGMADIGREMGRLGHELGRELAAAFKGFDWPYKHYKWYGKHYNRGGDTRREEPSAKRAQHRSAILRMVAEGRISPEEGDMLLSGLDR